MFARASTVNRDTLNHLYNCLYRHPRPWLQFTFPCHLCTGFLGKKRQEWSLYGTYTGCVCVCVCVRARYAIARPFFVIHVASISEFEVPSSQDSTLLSYNPKLLYDDVLQGNVLYTFSALKTAKAALITAPVTLRTLRRIILWSRPSCVYLCSADVYQHTSQACRRDEGCAVIL